MKFFFPDAQDVVYPGYDFVNDEYAPHRVRQRDDRYAHEILDPIPYDGMLVSLAIVNGIAKAGKYSQAQRDRLYRNGARAFFRLPDHLALMGDCGAFSYIDEDVPPVKTNEVLDFYEACGCDAGLSVDHMIPAFEPDGALFETNDDWAGRRRMSLNLAEEFLAEVGNRRSPIEPVGTAQGWSPASYADSVTELQEMGYQRIALGGLVPLKTDQILQVVESVSHVRKPEVALHLLGIARPEVMDQFAAFGVSSFDSTSPFRQAFMDDRKNYHTLDDHYVAIRVPQIEGNAALKRRILSGEIQHRDAFAQEKSTLKALWAFDQGSVTTTEVLERLAAYEKLTTPNRPSYLERYRRTLDDRPWQLCPCVLCRLHGIDIAIFRGTERNKRRGFHNLAVLGQKVPGRPAHAGIRDE